MTTPPLRPLDAEATVKTLNQEAARFQALAAAQLAIADTAQQHKLGDVAATALTLKRVYEEAAERLYSIVDAVVAARPGQQGQGQGQGQTQPTPQSTPTQPATLSYFKQVSPSTHMLAQRVLSSQLKPAQRYIVLAQLLDSDDVAAQLPSPVLAELRTAYVLVCKDLPQLDAVRDSLIELQRRWIAQSSDADVAFVAKALGFVSSAMGLIETGSPAYCDVPTYRTGIDHAVANLQAGLWPGGEIQATGQAIITELQRLRHDAAIRKRLDAA